MDARNRRISLVMLREPAAALGPTSSVETDDDAEEDGDDDSDADIHAEIVDFTGIDLSEALRPLEAGNIPDEHDGSTSSTDEDAH